METEFLRENAADELLSIAIIVPRYNGQWVFCRHRNRSSWEFPGGHREPGETILQTAQRELWEETGIRDAKLQVVTHFRFGSSYGALFFAEAAAIGAIPEGSEMAGIHCSEILPRECAYSNLPLFHDWVQGWLNLQSSADELWDVYDRDRNSTGRLHRRGDLLPPGDYHLVVHVWTRDSSGKYLITKRSPNKGFPNMWEPTGGSALAGDDSLTAAIREVREETGLVLDPGNGHLVETRRWTDHFDDMWLFTQDFDLTDVHLLEGETCDARKATAEDILRLHREGLFVPIDDLPQLLETLEHN